MFKAKLKTKSSSAFTIIELVIVIAIIAILTAIGFVSYQGLTKKAKEVAIKSDISNAKKQLELHKAQYGSYPTTNNCDQEVNETNICLKTSPSHELDYTPESDGSSYNIGITTDDGYWTIDERGDIVKLTGWKEIVAGNYHTCGLTYNKQAYCWGANDYGQLGNGTTGGNQSTSQPVSGGLVFQQLTASYGHTCGLTTDNKAYCWGANDYGQLGNGTTGGNQSTPQPVSGSLIFQQLTAGIHHTCGLTIDKKAYCWGLNNFGQLGNGTTGGNQSTPQPVSGNYSFIQLVTGLVYTCGLTTDKQAYCWGKNDYGQLGNGESTGNNPNPLPRLVSDSLGFQQLTAGFSHTCGLTTNNQAYCWGWNYDGQLGNGETKNYNLTPQPVSDSLGFQQLTAGYGYTCGLTTNNQAYCWGSNEYGQLGNGEIGSYKNKSTPQPVRDGLKFQQLTAGGYHVCSLADDNKAYCWGYNNYGQLGNGETGNGKSTPTPVTPPF